MAEIQHGGRQGPSGWSGVHGSDGAPVVPEFGEVIGKAVKYSIFLVALYVEHRRVVPDQPREVWCYQHLVIEDEDAHGDVIVAVTDFNSGHVVQLGQLIQGDLYACTDSKRHRFEILTAAGHIAFGIADQEPNVAAAFSLATENRPEVGDLQPQEVVRVTREG